MDEQISKMFTELSDPAHRRAYPNVTSIGTVTDFPSHSERQTFGLCYQRPISLSLTN
jgi:hypothetical protein